jgi:hypothetical protein
MIRKYILFAHEGEEYYSRETIPRCQIFFHTLSAMYVVIDIND